MELVKITQTQIGESNVNAVNARDLHKSLQVETRFNDWISRRIKETMAEENVDYIFYSNLSKTQENAGGRPSIDYCLTIDLAKEIAMLERSDIGKKIRRYFIECEKKLNQKMLPQTYKQALIELLHAVEENERLALENQTKQERIELLSHTGKGYTITEIAKELNMKSANELNKKLAEMKVQYKSNGTWVMYSKYSKKGYEIIKQEVTDNGAVIYHRKITQAGREFILNLFKGAENE